MQLPKVHDSTAGTGGAVTGFSDENVTPLTGDPAYLLGLKPKDLSRRLMNIADSIVLLTLKSKNTMNH